MFRKRFFPALVGLGFSLLLTACQSSAPNTPTASVDADSLALLRLDSLRADSVRRAAEAATQQAIQTADRYPDDLARYLAGLPGRDGSTLAALESLPSFQAHAKWWAQNWDKKQVRFLQPLQQLGRNRFPDLAQSDRTAFYPFSGADFLTVHAVYPQARQYVMFGLEPEGTLPDIRNIAPGELSAALDNMHQSLYIFLAISFFKTEEMKTQFRATQLTGTAPILLAMLARTGHRVIGVKHVLVGENSPLAVLSSPPPAAKESESRATGLQFDVLDEASGTRKQLTYWSLDVSDGGLAKLQPYQAYLRSLGPANTYIKSASYLMYKPYFSTIRGLVLDASQVILQDDSGMPIKHFGKDKWALQVFGTYDGPIGLFSNWYQADLKAAYAADSSAKPLGFQIGYDRESNLQLARKK